ncbi:unnamed protein product [Meganyctiphanes norvegica]|uniref:Odorant receptor n=1 Tax=Meganyctiphanes norvegica TaxID=48144 RepID=A0AAV2SV48_MEGNR
MHLYVFIIVELYFERKKLALYISCIPLAFIKLRVYRSKLTFYIIIKNNIYRNLLFMICRQEKQLKYVFLPNLQNLNGIIISTSYIFHIFGYCQAYDSSAEYLYHYSLLQLVVPEWLVPALLILLSQLSLDHRCSDVAAPFYFLGCLYKYGPILLVNSRSKELNSISNVQVCRISLDNMVFYRESTDLKKVKTNQVEHFLRCLIECQVILDAWSQALAFIMEAPELMDVADVTECLGHYHKLHQLVEAIEEKEASISEDISSFSPALTSTWSATHLVQCLTEAQPEVLDNSVDISVSSDDVLSDASIAEEPMSSEEINMNGSSQNYLFLNGNARDWPLSQCMVLRMQRKNTCKTINHEQKSLFKTTKEMKIDGTFGIIKKPHYQLLSVHAVYNNLQDDQKANGTSIMYIRIRSMILTLLTIRTNNQVESWNRHIFEQALCRYGFLYHG